MDFSMLFLVPASKLCGGIVASQTDERRFANTAKKTLDLVSNPFIFNSLGGACFTRSRLEIWIGDYIYHGHRYLNKPDGFNIRRERVKMILLIIRKIRISRLL